MTEKVFVQTFLFVWIYIAFGSIVTYFVSGSDTQMALNFFLGGAVSVMLMSHNYKSTMRTAQKDPESLKRIAMRNYFFRYGFYILILTIVYLRTDAWQPLIPVFFGFLAFKITMMLNFFITRLWLARKGVDLDD